MSQAEWKRALQFVCCNGREGDRLEETLSELKLLVKLSLDIKNRECVGEEDIAALASVLDSFSVGTPGTPSSHPTSPTQLEVEVLTETLKLLRNLCVELPSNQELITSHGSVLAVVERVVESYGGSPHHIVLCTVALQLMANLCVGQRSGQEAVWNACFPELFKVLMLSEGANGCHDNLACMLLYYCTRENEAYRTQLHGQGRPLLLHVTSRCLATSRAWEWSSLLVSSLLPRVPLRDLAPPTHSSKLLLPFLKFVLLHSDPSTPHTPEAALAEDSKPLLSVATATLDAENISFLMEVFRRCTMIVMEERAGLIREAYATPTPSLEKCGRSCDQEDGVEDLLPLDFPEVRACHASLSLLCNYASRGQQLPLMQATPTLLDDSLRLMNELCTLDDSSSTTQNRSQLRVAMPTEGDTWHPLYGFKRDLVKLVGNLSYRCSEVQERLREGGGVTLILNQCGIDHRNPYIGQWAVFAIRNLCEDNPANQQLIAGLRAQGACPPVDESALRAAGGVVEVGPDGRIIVSQNTHRT